MLALRVPRPYAAHGMDAARSPSSSSRAAVKRAPAGPRLTERLRGEIHAAALAFVAERYELTTAQRDQRQLVSMMMHSDGVSEKDFEALWQRARGAVPLATDQMQCNCAMGG
jgi:phage terminase Nu1 subunit (DNA packaging protein)